MVLPEPFVLAQGELYVRLAGQLINVLDIESFQDEALERALIELLAGFFDFFAPARYPAILAPHWLHLELFNSEEVTFYPGTFNPWHAGHLNCIKLCPEKSIVIVPDFSPWKSESGQRPWQRVQVILKEIKSRAYMTYPAFTLLTEGHTTFSWMQKVRRPKCNLIVGMDNFAALSRWREASSLLRLLHKLYVVPRSNVSEDQITAAKLFVEQSCPELPIIFLPEHDEMETSSTELRAQK